MIGGLDVYIRNSIQFASGDLDYVIMHGMDDYKTPVYCKGKEVKEYSSSLQRNLNPWKDVQTLYQAIRIISKERPDVVHCHTEAPDMGVVLAMRSFPWIAKRCKVVRTIHNNCLWTGQARIGNACERFFISHKSNVAISESVRRSYLERFGVDVPIIYNGVDEVCHINMR